MSADFDEVLAEPAAPPRPTPTPEPASPPPPKVAPPSPAKRPSGWRADPRWQLVAWDEAYFESPPADVPPEDAELAQPDSWASLYAGARIVATWSRVSL